MKKFALKKFLNIFFANMTKQFENILFSPTFYLFSLIMF